MSDPVTLFKKHRAAADFWDFDFTAELAAMGVGITLTGTPTVAVAKVIPGGYLGITADIVEAAAPAPTLTAGGTKILFKVNAAASGKQPAGAYKISAACATTDGRIAVGIADLAITDAVTG